MDFYNPFKPHIVERHDGQFQVRKFALLLGWRYLGLDDAEFWWSSDNIEYSIGTKEACLKAISYLGNMAKAEEEMNKASEVKKVHKVGD